MDLTCLEKKHELENTYWFITTKGLQATLQYLPHNRDISQWTEQWDSCRQLHRMHIVKLLQKFLLLANFIWKMVGKVLQIVPGPDWAKEKLEMTNIGPCVSRTNLLWKHPIGLVK